MKGTRKRTRPPDLLNATDLSFVVGNGKTRTSILEKASLKLNAGEVVGLVGSNGAGKTTLLKILAGASKPESGTIEILGEPLRGVIFQEQSRNLLPWLSGLDNVALPLRLKGMNKVGARQKAAHELKRLKAESLAKRLPRAMSGGQRQLLIICRWLAAQPTLLFADEVFSELDPHQRARSALALRHLANLGAGLLIVSHHLWDLARIVDRVYLLSGPPGTIQREISFNPGQKTEERARCLSEAVSEDLAKL